jgi:hypothetical protein
MANKIEAKCLMAFKATPRNKDAIYYYKPGCPDMVVINPRFKHDRETVSRFISYLQADVEQKKRFSKGTMELRESCCLEDLPAVAPDFIIVDLPQDWGGGIEGIHLPGGELTYLGRAVLREGSSASF